MNLIDRAISFVSPKRGFERARYRAAEEALRSFEAASRGRRTANWYAPGSSANTENQPAIKTLRNRSRDLVRNNPYAKRAIQAIATNLVGTGIRPSPNTSSKQADVRIKKLWKEWAETKKIDWDGKHNIYGLQHLAVRTLAESGEVVILRRRVNDKRMPLPIQLQVLEGDFIDTDKDGIYLATGGVIFQGIEFNNEGKRVAYWLYKDHPGDNRMRALESQRVLASDVLHIYTVDRPGQIRGIPVGTSAMIKLKDFDEYEDAELVRQKVAACFGMVVTNDGSGGTSESLSEFEKLEPGMIYRAGAGEQISVVQPPAKDGYDVYSKVVLRAIAVGFGVSYETITSDLSNVNFSSGRMGWIEFNRIIQHLQENVIIPQMCDDIWEWFLDAAVMSFQLRETQKAPATWTAPRREMIDPEKETRGLSEQVKNGFVAWQEVVRQLGYDPEDTKEQIRKDVATFTELGITPACDPRYGARLNGGNSPQDENANNSTE